jgi:hypothetical protein
MVANTYVTRTAAIRRACVPMPAMSIDRRTATVAGALLLAGCAGAPTSRPGTPSMAAAKTGADAMPGVAPALVPEQRWLQDLFEGTPVSFSPGPDGALRIEMPIKFAFDPGRNVAKPPLTALAGKVAASLARQWRARVAVAAPSPERADSVRNLLQSRGVPAQRIDLLPAPRTEVVELRLLMPAS